MIRSRWWSFDKALFIPYLSLRSWIARSSLLRSAGISDWNLKAQKLPTAVLTTCADALARQTSDPEDPDKEASKASELFSFPVKVSAL